MNLLKIGVVLCAIGLAASAPATAGPFEDAKAAYQKGDYVTAATLFRQLAAQGNADAQSFLAFMYHDGEGVPRDYVRSYMWFSLAASLYPADSQDFHDTMEARDIAAKSMSPSQIETATNMAYACQAQKYQNCD